MPYVVEHIIGEDRLRSVEEVRREQMGFCAYHADAIKRKIQGLLGRGDEYVFHCSTLEELKPYLTHEEYRVYEEREMMQRIEYEHKGIVLFSYDIDNKGEVCPYITVIRTFDHFFKKSDR